MSKTYLVNEADLTAIADAIRAKSGTAEPLTFSSEMVNVIETLSSGTELNFEVVGGTTQPENPTENMIWINTDTEITGWNFSSETPLTTESTWGITSEGNKALYTLGGRDYIKVNEGMVVYTLTSPTGQYWAPILVSTNPDSVSTTTSYASSEIKTYAGTVEYNGATYYYCRANYGMEGTITATPIITTAITDEEAALYLAEKYEILQKLENTVWIVTGKTSAISFDILEENVLTVYPLMSYQFINGEFVIKDAQIYQSGEWQPIGCYVVQNGVKKVDIQEKGDGHTIDWDQDGWCYMQCVKSGSDVTSYVYCYTSEPIDMTDFNSITLNYRALGGNCYKAMGMSLGVCASAKTPTASYGGLGNADAQVSASPAALGVDWDLSPYKELGNTGNLTLDVSSFSGEYRIIWALVNNSIGSSTINRYTKSYIGSIELKG